MPCHYEGVDLRLRQVSCAIITVLLLLLQSSAIYDRETPKCWLPWCSERETGSAALHSHSKYLLKIVKDSLLIFMRRF